MSSLLNLNNKTAAVIGASSGIGRAVALLLAEHGANVVLCARRADKLEETAALIAHAADGLLPWQVTQCCLKRTKPSSMRQSESSAAWISP